MAKASKKTDVGELDPMLQMKVRVSAPLGARRRAGHSFTNVARDVPLAELGDDMESAQKVVDILMADPQLSVMPVVEEGAVEPAEGDGDQG